MAQYKCIAHCETFRNLKHGIVRIEDKVFNTYDEAEKYCEKWRKDHVTLGAWVTEEIHPDHGDLALDKAMHTVNKYSERFWKGAQPGKMFH